MTHASHQVEHARNRAGQRRKEIERLVGHVLGAHGRCRGDRDKAAVLDVFVKRVREIQEEGE